MTDSNSSERGPSDWLGDWFRESLNAFADAKALLLGSVTALSVIAALRPELASVSLKWFVENWRYISHKLWGEIGQLLGVVVPADIAAALSMAALATGILIRGYLIGQRVPVPTDWIVQSNVVFGFIGLAGILATGDENWQVTPANFFTVFSALIMYSGVILTIAFFKTPRAFWGVVIAAGVFFVIDRIPVPPAS